MRHVIVLGTLIATGGLSIAVAGGQGQANAPRMVNMQTLNVRDILYVMKGGGGNTMALMRDEGAVLIDTKLPGWGQPIRDAVAAVSDKPVATIINTNASEDRVGGNPEFSGVTQIIAHENTKANMQKMDLFKGANARFLPNKTFTDKMTLLDGIDRIDLYYFGAGHTNGDAWVVFPALRVAHAGDMFAGRQAPIIDAANGGSGLAYPDSLARVAAGIKNVDTIMTGHGDLMTWKDLDDYARFNRNFRDVVVSGFNHGLGISDVVEAWTLPQQYRGYAAPRDRVKANVQAIFGELTQ